MQTSKKQGHTTHTNRDDFSLSSLVSPKRAGSIAAAIALTLAGTNETAQAGGILRGRGGIFANRSATQAETVHYQSNYAINLPFQQIAGYFMFLDADSGEPVKERQRYIKAVLENNGTSVVVLPRNGSKKVEIISDTATTRVIRAQGDTLQITRQIEIPRVVFKRLPSKVTTVSFPMTQIAEIELDKRTLTINSITLRTTMNRSVSPTGDSSFGPYVNEMRLTPQTDKNGRQFTCMSVSGSCHVESYRGGPVIRDTIHGHTASTFRNSCHEAALNAKNQLETRAVDKRFRPDIITMIRKGFELLRINADNATTTVKR